MNQYSRGRHAILGLASMVAGLVILVAAPTGNVGAATQQATPPTSVVSGNPDCGELVGAEFEFKIEVGDDLPDETTYTDPATGFEVTIFDVHVSGGTAFFSFESNIPVSAVFVKAGPGGSRTPSTRRLRSASISRRRRIPSATSPSAGTRHRRRRPPPPRPRQRPRPRRWAARPPRRRSVAPRPPRPRPRGSFPSRVPPPARCSESVPRCWRPVPGSSRTHVASEPRSRCSPPRGPGRGTGRSAWL